METTVEKNAPETKTIKIAVPTAQGKLCMHFGHCESFALITVDMAGKTIISQEIAVPPPHEPGVLPRWLHDMKANVIIAGGMGMRAQQLFQQHGIQVVVGAPPEDPKAVVLQWINGTLQTGGNTCDH